MWSNENYSNQPIESSGVAGTQLAPVAAAPAPQQVSHTVVPLAEGAFDVPTTLADRIELCRFLADANLLPQALRKQPANILLIMHKSLALNIPLGVSLEHMHVIDGKVGHSAELLRALLFRHGHVLRWLSISDKEATGELLLRHDPKNPRREQFTIAQAQTMGLVNKDNWKKDPQSMLVARCTTRLVSRHCPEIAVALGNLSSVDVDDDTNVPEPAQDADNTSDNTGPAPTLAEQAAALFAETRAAENAEQVKQIGYRAKQADLLNHVVDDDATLQQVLLRRIQELSQDVPETDRDKNTRSTSGKTGDKSRATQ